MESMAYGKIASAKRTAIAHRRKLWVVPPLLCVSTTSKEHLIINKFAGTTSYGAFESFVMAMEDAHKHYVASKLV